MFLLSIFFVAHTCGRLLPEIRWERVVSSGFMATADASLVKRDYLPSAVSRTGMRSDARVVQNAGFTTNNPPRDLPHVREIAETKGTRRCEFEHPRNFIWQISDDLLHCSAGFPGHGVGIIRSDLGALVLIWGQRVTGALARISESAGQNDTAAMAWRRIPAIIFFTPSSAAGRRNWNLGARGASTTCWRCFHANTGTRGTNACSDRGRL